MKDKLVVITGGTGGLGTAVTERCLDKGAWPVIPYISEEEITRLKNKLSSSDYSRIRFTRADLLEEKQVKALFADLEKVDVLIHLVGGFSMGDTAAYKFAAWRQQIDLNLTSAFLACKYSLPLMQEKGYGRIVTIGSRTAVEPAAQMAAYCAAKAGVIAMTRAIAEETKGSGITANCVLPGIIDTPANRAAMGTSQLDTWVAPESLAGIICFLASEAAADLRGSAIPVYGNL